MAAPAQAATAGVAGDAAFVVNHVNLAMVGAFVRADKHIAHVVRRNSLAHEVHPKLSPSGIGQRLAGERANARLCPWADRAHSQIAGGNDDSEQASLMILCDDRPGHPFPSALW